MIITEVMASAKAIMKQNVKRTFKIIPILSLFLIQLLLDFMPYTATAATATSATKTAVKKETSRRKKSTPTPAPLIDKAAHEIHKIQNKKKTSSTAVSDSSGIFTVQEPPFKITARSWKYLLGLKAQSIKPAGTFHSSIVGDFNLNSYQTHILPTLELGLKRKYETLAPWSDWSVLAQMGYSSAQVPVIFQTGYKAPANTRLNMMKANIGIETQRALFVSSTSYYKAGISIGKFFYSQTSMNDLAQFSESFLFGAMNLGLTHSWWESFNVSVDYIFRRPLQSSPLQLQAHNVELGLQVQW